LIGLGAGKTSVSADTQIYYATDRSAPPRLLMSFEGQADSGHLPGVAETLGAGAAAQSVGRSAFLTGATHAGAEGLDADRTTYHWGGGRVCSWTGPCPFGGGAT
jgi:hypothetical protein